MGIFRQFPYSNFHEMNMDWLLNTWKDFSAQFDIWQTSVNDTIAEFKKYIEDVPFDKYVNDVLTKWLDDGTFEDIIRSLVMPQRELIISREMRYISTPNNPLGGQGCCYYDSFIYLTGQNGADQVIHKCNLNGEVIESHTYSDLGHANSITLANNKIYVADGAGAKVVVLDLDTWNITNVITPADFDNIWSVSAFNDKVYILGSDVNAPTSIMFFGEVVDDTDINIIHRITNPANLVRQNMCVKDNSIFILFNQANMIYEYDLNTAQMISALYLPNGDGYYPTGEPEALFVMSDAIYLMGMSYYRYDYSYDANMVAQIFITNADGKTIVQSQNEYSYYESEARLVLKVDDTLTPEKNPYDTFTTLEEACMIANYHRTADIECVHIDEAVIHLINGDYHVTMAGGDRVITRLWCENSKLYLQAALELHDVRFSRVDADMHTVNLFGSFTASFSKVKMSVVSMASLTSITSQCVEWVFDRISAVNSSLNTGTANTRSSLHIIGPAVNNLLLLMKINGGGGPFVCYNTGGIIFLISSTMVTNQAINITVGGNTVTYSSGVFGGSVSSSNIIEIIQTATA